MADKQIIINNIDVSECEHLYREIDCLAHIDFSECCEGYNPSYGYCPNIPNCYYKQLKRAEQENKRQLDKLKTENDLYKNAHKTEQDRRRSYENALTEIKEIAEKQCNICEALTPIDEYKDCKKCWQGKILQKISKCEDNQ